LSNLFSKKDEPQKLAHPFLCVNLVALTGQVIFEAIAPPEPSKDNFNDLIEYL
jgi:hypothetical protein